MTDHDDLQPTGERFLPGHYAGQLVHAEHLARYRWAAALAPGRRVLDVACGEGYGSALLAAAGATSVVGVDVDEATVAHVREHHGVEARAADVRELPFDDDSFDLVVSFETIEHVEQPERALDELARVLAPGGLLAISTPVEGQYQVANEFHVREFGHEEFLGLLRERFPSVSPWFQHNWLTSALLTEPAFGEADGERPVALDTTKVRGLQPGEELYLVALCGTDTAVELPQVAVMAGTDEAHDLAHRLDDAVRTQERYHDAHEDVSRQLEEMRQRVIAMSESLSWRVTKPLRLRQRLRRR